MKAALMLMAMPAAVMAGIKASQEQDFTNGYSAWRCGHWNSSSYGNTPSTSAEKELEALMNPDAGIVFLKDGSLDYIRVDSAELAALDDATKAKYLASDFSSLFCYDYIKGYKNAAGEPDAPAGMCIQNINVGSKWEAILTADNAARETWNWFGTQYGYQKSVGVYKTHPTPDYMTMWGSGRSGSNPSNWCGVYMKQTLCHVAFPQYAENTTEANLKDNGLGAMIRPVCSDWCNTVMDNCNRREPVCYKCSQDWINNFTNPSTGLTTGKTYSLKTDNSMYCDAWNKGYGEWNLVRAGTGIGAGPDDNDEKYCAQWDAAPTVGPLSLVAVVIAVIATVL
eukprot:TRINITY_DN1821_c0_g1_i2.p2 TRINITY_DN1821_c0_g1~~TRINITY_DN1821_c0_g1_i2.p2  ORF type:complete len:338 (+),score=119.71 TRINITY_DN1821_c0_g1_i2:67-1080(+)